MHCAVEETMAAHIFYLLLNKWTNPDKKKKIGSCYWSMYYRIRLYWPMGCLDHKETPCPFRGALYQFLVRTGLTSPPHCGQVCGRAVWDLFLKSLSNWMFICLWSVDATLRNPQACPNCWRPLVKHKRRLENWCYVIYVFGWVLSVITNLVMSWFSCEELCLLFFTY